MYAVEFFENGNWHCFRALETTRMGAFSWAWYFFRTHKIATRVIDKGRAVLWQFLPVEQKLLWQKFGF